MFIYTYIYTYIYTHIYTHIYLTVTMKITLSTKARPNEEYVSVVKRAVVASCMGNRVIHMCAMTSSCVLSDSFIRVCHYPSMCVQQLIYMCAYMSQDATRALH